MTCYVIKYIQILLHLPSCWQYKVLGHVPIFVPSPGLPSKTDIKWNGIELQPRWGLILIYNHINMALEKCLLFFLQATQAGVADAISVFSIWAVEGSGSQTGEEEDTSHPSLTSFISLHTLHSPVERHFRLEGVVGHFPLYFPSPIVTPSETWNILY